VKKKAFEVAAFWMEDRDWMIESLPMTMKNTNVSLRFGACAEEDVLKELFADVIRARTGEKETVGGHFFDGHPIEIFVGAKCLVDIFFLFYESGWIENDQVVIERFLDDEVDGIFSEESVVLQSVEL